MNELISKRINSSKKIINVRELYIEKNFRSSTKSSLTIHLTLKPTRCSSRLSGYRYGKSRPPLIPDKVKDSGFLIQTIQSPTDVKMSFDKTMRRSCNEAAFAKTKAREIEDIRKSSKINREDFFAKAFKARKMKLSISLAPKRPASQINRIVKTPIKNGKFEIKDALTGWE